MKIVNGQMVNDDGTPVGPAPIPLPSTPSGPAPALGSPTNPITIIPPGETPPAPAAPAAPAAPQVVVPPAAKAVSKTTTTVSSSKASPEEKAANIEVAAADKKVGEAYEAEGKNASEVAGSQAATSEKLAGAEDQNAVAMKAAIEQGNAHLADERQKLAQMENGPKDYFEGRPGARIASALAVAMGELGAALTKSGHNTALEIINKNIDDWRSERFAALRRQQERVTDARQASADAMAQVNIETIARRQALAAHGLAEAQKIGTPHAMLEAERLKAEQDRKAAAEGREFLQSTRTRVQSTTERENVTGGPGAGAAGGNLVIRDINGNPVPLEGKVTPQGQALPATARDAKAADEIDTQRAGTSDLIANVTRLKQLAQQGMLGRGSSNLSGDAEGLRKDTVMHYLRATVGRINEQELKNSDQVVPSIGYLNAVRDPVKVYDAFLERAKRQTVNELASKTNLSKAQAQKVVNQWYQGTAADGAPSAGGSTAGDQAAIQWARANPKDPRAPQILRANGL